jgi:hypothetical protein
MFFNCCFDFGIHLFCNMRQNPFLESGLGFKMLMKINTNISGPVATLLYRSFGSDKLPFNKPYSLLQPTLIYSLLPLHIFFIYFILPIKSFPLLFPSSHLIYSVLLANNLFCYFPFERDKPNLRGTLC